MPAALLAGIRNALLVGFSLFVSLALAEAGLRLGGYSWPAFYTMDNQVGGALRPGANGWFTSEGKAWISINSHGQRDRERSYAKPAGTFRIAVLGDSFVEALQVPLEKTFCSVIERRLDRSNAVGGKPVEVLNFGNSGYGTAQELMILRSRVWKYDPDLVLLAFLPGNDVRNNSRALEKDPLRPYFVFRDGRLELDNAFQSKFGGLTNDQRAVVDRKRFKWSDRLILVQLWNRIVLLRKEKAKPPPAPQVIEAGLDEKVFRPPPDADWAESWRVTEALLGLMGEEVRSHGARFLVVTLTSGVQVLPDRAEREREMAEFGASAPDYPDRRVAEACRERGIPVLMLVRGMREYAERNRVYLHGFGKKPGYGHWNEVGHRVAGERMADAVAELLAQGASGQPR